MNRRRLLAGTGALAAAAALGIKPVKATEKPNILLVIMDDLRSDDWQYMPSVQQIAAQGRTYANWICPTPLCSPSRASILTGKYARNHGITVNVTAFEESKLWDKWTIATVMQSAGYKTGLFGKYLNGYKAPECYRAPRWNHWYVPQPQAYYDRDFIDGTTRTHPSGHTDILTANRMKAWIANRIAADEPFFGVYSCWAPHGPWAFEPEDVDKFPEFSGNQRNRLRAVQPADRKLGEILACLPENTYVLVTSDNGFRLGEGKMLPYEDVINVGAFLRGPGIVAGSSATTQYANIDILPMAAHWAGAAIPWAVDGLMTGHDVLELEQMSQPAGLPAWWGWRTNQHKHVEYADGSVLDEDIG
jgi:arylsulfatase A-like enzyme